MKASWLALVALVGMTGCFGGPATQNGLAYGASGKTYTAPAMCGALSACLAAGEKRCFYEYAEEYGGSTPNVEIDGCAEVAAKPPKGK